MLTKTYCKQETVLLLILEHIYTYVLGHQGPGSIMHKPASWKWAWPHTTLIEGQRVDKTAHESASEVEEDVGKRCSRVLKR